MQSAIDAAIIKEHQPAAAIDNIAVRLQRHPYPPYTEDPYVFVIQSQLPFMILLSFIVTAANISKDVVLEKEKKLKVRLQTSSRLLVAIGAVRIVDSDFGYL